MCIERMGSCKCTCRHHGWSPGLPGPCECQGMVRTPPYLSRLPTPVDCNHSWRFGSMRFYTLAAQGLFVTLPCITTAKFFAISQVCVRLCLVVVTAAAWYAYIIHVHVCYMQLLQTISYVRGKQLHRPWPRFCFLSGYNIENIKINPLEA